LAVAGVRRLVVQHPVEAVELLLDRRRHRRGDVLRSSAGYVAVTWIVGGVIWGYRLTGSDRSAKAPSRVITMEITAASTAGG